MRAVILALFAVVVCMANDLPPLTDAQRIEIREAQLHAVRAINTRLQLTELLIKANQEANTAQVALEALGLNWGDKLYWLSVGTMVAGHTFDAVSSYGAGEANPFMRSSNGRLGVRGIALGAGIMGVVLLAQRLCGKRSRKAFTPVNFAVGGFRVGIATRNFIILRRRAYAR